MKKHKLLISFVSILIMFTAFNSCSDDLNETTYSSITSDSYTFSEDDLGKAIGPAYLYYRNLFSGWFSAFSQEIGTDELAQPANASGWSGNGEFLRFERHAWKTSGQRHISQLWSKLYKGVINTNRIISSLEEGRIKVPSSTSSEAIISEMRTARAMYYWLLMDNFGDVPLVTSPSGSSTELPSKTPRQEIYQFLVTELSESIPNLNESADQSMYGRFNKWAGKTLLAAIYLNAEVYTGDTKWDESLEQVNDVISSGKYSLDPDYSDPFKVHNENSAGIVFAIPFDPVNARNFNWLYASWHSQLKKHYQTSATGFGAGAIKMVPQFGAIYDSLNDKRYKKTWLMGHQFTPSGDTIRGTYDKAGEPLNLTRKFENGVYTSEDAGFRIDKYEIQKGATRHLGNDIPFFRYARVLMMKAEVLLRTGKADEAASIVTQVRMRAFDDPSNAKITAEDLTKDSKINYGLWKDFGVVEGSGKNSLIEYGGFLDALGREFAVEFFRRRDMIRFGVYTTRSYLEHDASQGKEFHRVFPIPDEVVRSNPNLEQNPNYQ